MFEDHLISLLDFWGWEYVPNEMEFAEYIRATLHFVYYLLIAFRGKTRHEKTCFLHMRNRGTDRLRSNCASDQHLCFRYIYSTIPLLPKYQPSGHILLLYSPGCVGPGRKPENRFSRDTAHNVFRFSDRPRCYKTLSCSTQLSMRLKLHMNIEIVGIKGIFKFKPDIYSAH